MSKNFVRKGVIDGLPSSFDSNYVLKTHETCSLCQEKFVENDISENRILFADSVTNQKELKFVHKQCMTNNNLKYKHMREEDFASPVTVYDII